MAASMASFLSDDEITIIVEGTHLVAHGHIVGDKCGFLRSAIDFESSKRNQNHGSAFKSESTDTPLEIHVSNYSLRMVQWILQHCYHGSIVSGLSPNPQICCDELLELAKIAEEILCPSLLNECEMRLLAGKCNRCFCWCCCRTVDQKTKNGELTCFYEVRLPSSLICARNAIRIIETAEHFSSSVSGPGHKLRTLGTKNVDLPRPFLAVKHISLKVLLQEFLCFWKSDSFVSYYHEVLMEYDDVVPCQKYEDLVAMNLVQSILDELTGEE